MIDLKMEIRKITGEDLEAFRELRLEALRDSPAAFCSDYEREAAVSAEKFNRGLKPGDDFREAFVLGAWNASNDLIGMAGFHVPDRLKTRHKAWIWGMYVKANHRGQGAGESLLRAIFKEAKQIEGLEQILLSAITFSDIARRLYQRVGFVEYGREPNSLKVDGVNYDEVLMILKIGDLP